MDRRLFLKAAGIGAASAAGWAATDSLAQLIDPKTVPDEILNPVEVSGAKAQPVIGALPGEQRMYMLPAGKGERHEIGPFTMTRIARPLETGNSYELMTFTGASGAQMPAHAHVGAHAALLVMGGEVEVQVQDRVWRMMKGDFANLPAGAVFGWTNKSDRGQVALFTMGDRVGIAYAAMANGKGQTAALLSPGALARASLAGDFLLRRDVVPKDEAARVANLTLPDGTEPYVLLDGGGERFGGNTFYAKNRNTNGQFLFIMTEGGPGGIGAHFHARHTEDFFALDGLTYGWAYGKAVPLRPGDFFQAPPRHLHGFRMMEPYNRFVGFLTPGIFEHFFTRGQPGQNGVGGRGAGEGARVVPGARPAFGSAPSARPGAGGGSGGPPGGGFFQPNPQMFRGLSLSGRGPDGYPLDVHGAKLPLPKQDAFWTNGKQVSAAELRFQYARHALMCSGGLPYSEPMPAEVAAALRFKPSAESFV